jgi:hypothetical protein
MIIFLAFARAFRGNMRFGHRSTRSISALGRADGLDSFPSENTSILSPDGTLYRFSPDKTFSKFDIFFFLAYSILFCHVLVTQVTWQKQFLHRY